MSTSMIPPITDRLGMYWDQPDVANILLDDTHALMSKADFDKLSEYSTSDPTGVYVGKAWKSVRIVEHEGKYFRDGWWLKWYGYSNDPTRCSYNQRIILLAES